MERGDSMAVLYDNSEKLYSLNTKNTTYQMKVDCYGYLLHLYYGKKINYSMEYLLTYFDRGFSGNPYIAGDDRGYSLDVLPQEFPVQGTGDYRSVALVTREENGCYDCDLRYKGHQITDGKYTLPGLPAVYSQKDAQTLIITLEDIRIGLEVSLLYGVIEDCDIITRSVQIKNNGAGKVFIEKVLSACLDFIYGSYDAITFYGRHAMERNASRTRVPHGQLSIGSRRGSSSHQYNPFVIIAEKDTTEDTGGCYGAAFVYSGNFLAEAGCDQFGQTRFLMGLSDELFSYPLSPGEVFYAPEVALSYTDMGLSHLSQNFHHCIREHICRGRYKDQVRPVLINSWEACYFDFNGETLCRLADQAAELGIELLVLDDGWFGERNNDKSSLGDWSVNEKKLGLSLSCLAQKIHEKGLLFGIWIEPEMVSEDSNLYRSHPEWALQIPGKKPVRARSQLVLDFSNPEVVQYMFNSISRVLHQGDINYVKWDMNRSLSDIYSGKSSCQGKVLYDYMSGVYSLLEKLIQEFPDILWEGCAGGGGRFDAGMLYYTPQIWCSDNTDAIDRVCIQYGTSFGYPLSVTGSHVSAVPNHQTGRITDMNTRGVVAMTGAFGYELDLGEITEEEKEQVKEQVKIYHKLAPLIQKGDYYRLANPFEEEYSAWMVVDSMKEKALASVVILNVHGNLPVIYIRLKGLDSGKYYKNMADGKVYLGAALMYNGFPIKIKLSGYQAYQFIFEAEK